MTRKRVFISFDASGDQSLRDRLVAQAAAPESPFEVVGSSRAADWGDEEWARRAVEAIGFSDVVIVLLGPGTHGLPSVQREVGIAAELGRPRFQLKSPGSSPPLVAGAGRVYNWTWENLQALLGFPGDEGDPHRQYMGL